MLRIRPFLLLLCAALLVALPASASASKKRNPKCHSAKFRAHHRALCRHHAATKVRPSAAHAAVATPTPTVTPDPRPFAPTSFWNTRLADNAPIDPNSAGYVTDLQRQLTLATPWINTNSYSTRVYTVGADQPLVPVLLDNPTVDPWLAAAWALVPIPADAIAAPGTDGTAVVWQPSTDSYWEFWRLGKNSTGLWHAAYGGKMTSMSTNEGRFTAPAAWGAAATSLPWIGGLMRINELQSGHIDHALAMAIPQAAAGKWSWPAQRTDGTTAGANVIPEGARFRLDPTLDLSKLNLPPTTRMMAEAAQKYGIVVRDTAGSVAFYGEDAAGNPYYKTGGIFGGKYPDALMAAFPWSRLQLLKMDIHTK